MATWAWLQYPRAWILQYDPLQSQDPIPDKIFLGWHDLLWYLDRSQSN
jgi:hypothetical protein